MLVERIKNFASYQEESTSTVYKSAQRNTSETASLTEKINSTLTEDEKKALDIIYDGLKNCKSSVNIYQDIEPQRIFELVGLVLSEHPEIFWSKGDCTFSQSGRLTFEYPYSKSRISEIQTQIESRVSTIMTQIASSASEYEKALKIFDYITLNTSYARDEIENIEDNVKISTIEGVFIDNSAVCLGYAKAYQYLLNAAGIDAITVCGNAQTPDGDSGHAWNVDGYYYSRTLNRMADISGFITGTRTVETWYVDFKYGQYPGTNNGRYLTYQKIVATGSYTATGYTVTEIPVSIFNDDMNSNVKIITNIHPL